MVSVKLIGGVRKTVVVRDISVVLWSMLKQEARSYKVSCSVLLNSILDEKLNSDDVSLVPVDDDGLPISVGVPKKLLNAPVPGSVVADHMKKLNTDLFEDVNV